MRLDDCSRFPWRSLAFANLYSYSEREMRLKSPEYTQDLGYIFDNVFVNQLFSVMQGINRYR